MSPISVVETPEFLAAAQRIMDDDERGLLVDFLAQKTARMPKVGRTSAAMASTFLADIDVKAIRTRLNMTQEEFSGRFGFSIDTLRHWEQGRRPPEGRPAPTCWSSIAIARLSRKRWACALKRLLVG